jgi:pimeloyl-ACP methyl ester carboxylesterase
VLLVHGLNENHHSYDRLAADLARTGHRVLAFDSRGMGLSLTRTNGTNETWPSFDEADFQAMENDIAAASSFLRDDPKVIVGASIGANEALRFASEHVLVRSVVLLSPGLDDRGVTTQQANEAYRGNVEYVASNGDADAYQTAETLHAGRPDQTLRLWNGTAHGTQILAMPSGLADVEAWIDAHGS